MAFFIPAIRIHSTQPKDNQQSCLLSPGQFQLANNGNRQHPDGDIEDNSNDTGRPEMLLLVHAGSSCCHLPVALNGVAEEHIAEHAPGRGAEYKDEEGVADAHYRRDV